MEMLDVHADASLQTQALLVMIVSASGQLAAASLMQVVSDQPGNMYQHHGSKHTPTCKRLQTCHGSAGRHKQHSYMMSKRNCTEVLYLALLILVLAAGLLSKQSTLQAWR